MRKREYLYLRFTTIFIFEEYYLPNHALHLDFCALCSSVLSNGVTGQAKFQVGTSLCLVL